MADEFVQNILKSWNLEELIPLFVEQGINQDSFYVLNSDMIKELIPQIGQRAIFSKKFTDSLQLQQAEVLYVEQSSDNTETASPSATSSSASTSSSLDKISFEIYDQAPPRQNAFYGEEQFNMCLRPSYQLQLQQFLETTVNGRMILSTYEKNKILDRRARSQLTELIISYLLSHTPNRHLKNEDFYLVSKQICALFPSEKQNVYFVPPVSARTSRDKKSIIARGKLVDKYRNKLRDFRKAGMNLFTESKDKKLHVAETAENVEASIIWLKNNTEPWNDVLHHWNKTLNLRKNSTMKTVNEFMQEWPILNISFGYTLIDKDFDNLYPEKTLNLFTKWTAFINKVKEKIKVTDTRNLDELFNYIKEDTNNDTKVSVEIMALPYFFPPVGRFRHGRKKQWKPSIMECQESMIVHIKLAADIESFIASRRKKFEDVGINVQPYMIVQGANFNSLEAFYVVIDNTFYKLGSALKALDVCFKIFQILNAQYPVQSEHIWYVIQHDIYNIVTEYDKQIPNVSAILSTLNSDS